MTPPSRAACEHRGVKKRSGPSGSGRTKRSRIPRLRRPAAERGTSRNSTRRKIEGAAASTSRTTLLIGAVSLVVVGAAITSVIVLPLQTYLGQGDEIDRLETELERMTAINDDLQAEVDRLRTDTGVEEAAPINSDTYLMETRGDHLAIP